jgi:hypothetical protein
MIDSDRNREVEGACSMMALNNLTNDIIGS